MTEHEELLMLRALVEKQKMQIKKQKIQIENMIQALLHARKKLFGPSSEISSQMDIQMNLFETTQELAKELFHEQKKITIPSYTRIARQPGIRAEMLDNLPKEIEEYIINPEEKCIKCNGELKVIGKKFSVRKLNLFRLN